MDLIECTVTIGFEKFRFRVLPDGMIVRMNRDGIWYPAEDYFVLRVLKGFIKAVSVVAQTYRRPVPKGAFNGR